jgi:hypothetical protein
MTDESLTLILYDIIPNSVRSARGRSHEASCGWDRMRRPRPGEDASPAPGPRRELRPAATMSRPPGAWLSGPTARRVLRPKREARAGATDGPCKARPGAVRKTPRWRAMRRPRLSRGSAAQNEKWLRHLARHLPRRVRGGNCGKRRQACPGPRQTTWAITLGFQRHRKCCRLPTPVTTLQQL